MQIARHLKGKNLITVLHISEHQQPTYPAECANYKSFINLTYKLYTSVVFEIFPSPPPSLETFIAAGWVLLFVLRMLKTAIQDHI